MPPSLGRATLRSMSAAPPINPFAPPKAPIDPVPDDLVLLGSATKSQRLLNLVIDYVAVLILSFVIGVGWALVTSTALHSEFPLFDQLFGMALMLCFYVSLEASTGRTPGKLLTGTKVVREDGRPPSFGQIVGRSFARFVPFEAFSFLGASDTGWHDRWSGTKVVRTR